MVISISAGAGHQLSTTIHVPVSLSLLLVVTKFSMSNQLFGLSIPPPSLPSLQPSPPSPSPQPHGSSLKLCSSSCGPTSELQGERGKLYRVSTTLNIFSSAGKYLLLNNIILNYNDITAYSLQHLEMGIIISSLKYNYIRFIALQW